VKLPQELTSTLFQFTNLSSSKFSYLVECVPLDERIDSP
jgi:hypothetical protein